MTISPHLQAIFTAAVAIWVGGWGFVMLRYPEFFARINARFGVKTLAGSKYISLTKGFGIVGMVLAALSVVVFLIEAALGLARF
jgi:hypothetical protein